MLFARSLVFYTSDLKRCRWEEIVLGVCLDCFLAIFNTPSRLGPRLNSPFWPLFYCFQNIWMEFIFLLFLLKLSFCDFTTYTRTGRCLKICGIEKNSPFNGVPVLKGGFCLHLRIDGQADSNPLSTAFAYNRISHEEIADKNVSFPLFGRNENLHGLGGRFCSAG